MKKKLTQAFNSSKYHNPNKPVFIIDTVLGGFGIKINPSGKAVYYAEKKIDRKTKRFTISSTKLMSLLQAKEEAKQFLSDSYTPIKKMSLSTLIDEYLRTKPFSRWTVRDYSNTTNHFDDMEIASITGQQVNYWYSEGKSTPATTDRVYRQLNALLGYAVKVGYIPTNPCKSLLHRYKQNSKRGYLEPVEQLPRFWKVLCKRKGVTADMIRVYLLAGMRRREIFSTTLQNLSGIDTLVVANTKNGSTHYIPIPPSCGEIVPLELFKVNHSDWTRDCRKTLASICEEAKVPVVTVHDLRRTVARIASLKIPLLKGRCLI